MKITTSPPHCQSSKPALPDIRVVGRGVGETKPNQEVLKKYTQYMFPEAFDGKELPHDFHKTSHENID